MHPSAGGPPVVVEKLVRESSKSGHISEIISSALFCKGDEGVLLEQLNSFASASFVAGSQMLAPLHGSTRRQVGEGVRIADIVHVHTLWSPLNLVVRQECARYRCPYVLMPHGMLDPYSLKVKRWRKAFYLWAVERRNILAAQRVIYTTPEEERLVQVGFGSLPKGVVVPLGGDAPWESCRQLALQFVDRFPTARGRRQLLFLGRLHFKKGLDRILNALPTIIKEFPDVLLTIVGDGAAEFEARLKTSVAIQGMQNHVLFTGRLDGAAKWGAYASAELFLLPSRQENFAITVAEAMQMGVPVVVSSQVNSWPYVTQSGGGLVLADDRLESDLGTSISSLLRDRAMLRQMGVRGQEFARKHLTWWQATNSLLSCYEDVIRSVSPSH
jgi:glycosyltransferase involved in cell wall biosynthesis